MQAFFVLFVCKANMCRSPTAQAVLRKMARDHGLETSLTVDSAGTHNRCPDSPPDERSQKHAARRGYELSDLRARQITQRDFELADLILVMDAGNLATLRESGPPAQLHKLSLLTEFCGRGTLADVPDPYYGDVQDFELVLDLVEDACAGLIRHVRAKGHGSP